MAGYPYEDRYAVNRTLPEKGRPREEILAELAAMAEEEDAFWETGKCSGTMYCGDHEHYAFMNEAFGRFAHVNALQRDMCPSQTKFEAEIIGMTLDVLNGQAVTDAQPVGVVTTGGTGSILHAMLAYREYGAQERNITKPNVIKPETAHPAFDKACHLFGIELRKAPVDRRPRRSTSTGWPRTSTTTPSPSSVRRATTATARSIPWTSCPTWRSPRRWPARRRLSRWVHPAVRSEARLRRADLRLPASRGHEHQRRHPQVRLRVQGFVGVHVPRQEYRNAQYFFLTDWSGGKYCSPGIEGSRSGGIIAATWAAMVSFGWEGYLRYAKKIFETSAAMQDAVRSHPELSMLGDPTFLFSFTSDEFDVYHVNDFMRPRGWRFNGQQYPNALHMAVTRPQTQEGVAEAFAADLAEGVQYALDHKDEPAKSGAIYGGVAGGMTNEADEFIRAVMADMMDEQQALPL